MTYDKCRKFFRVALATVAALTVLAGSAKAAEENPYKIPLKLFGEFEINGGLARCHFALWQHNRDPGTDKYAYLFYMPFDADGAPLPARLEIGSKVLSLDELVRDGSHAAGMAVHALYATPDRQTRAHIEVLEAAQEDGYTRIDRATLYVTRSGKVPFQARARGQFGCPGGPRSAKAADPAPAAERAAAGWSGPRGIPVGAAQMLGDISEVPAELRKQMRAYAMDDCDVDGFFPWGGAKYVVNENYLLWEVPCFSGAYQAASAFGVTQNPPQGWAELLTLPNPPGLEGQQNYAAMNAQIVPGDGLLKITALSRGTGDCGVYQVHRLIDGPGEVLEFELLDYRDKYDCDGNVTVPEAWPLAYRSY
ncbi:DUF1176 domain-containing protein [Roseibium sp.]|uniref:DUF1176 domain-containing protein n=1 Tax=Roseibium sp. TaxID=1936156 RepID=UPI003A97FD47